jgi:hypothetical protein
MMMRITSFLSPSARPGQITILTLLWISMILFVNPAGEFPINDDWAYTHNVQSLIIDGKFEFSNWPAMTLISQTLIGAGISKVFGFSHEVLRSTTIILAWLTCIVSYLLVDKVVRQKNLAFLFAFFLMVHPFFFTMANSFMTEVYFMLFSLTSMYFMVDQLKTTTRSNYMLMVVFMLLAIMVRQTALILPMAYFIIQLFYRPSWKKALLGFIPVFIGISALQLYASWRSGLPQGLGNLSSISSLIDSVKNMHWVSFHAKITWIFFYVGLTTIPIMIIALSKLRERRLSWKLIGVLPILAFIIYSFLVNWNHIPVGNVLNEEGLGPRLLKDNWLGTNTSEIINGSLWTFLKNLSIVSICVNALFLYRNFPSLAKLRELRTSATDRQLFSIFIGIVLSGLVVFLILNPVFFDRYTLTISVMLALLGTSLIKTLPKVNKISALVVMSLFAVIISVSLKDYFSWQRARWKLISKATAQEGISSQNLDGGFEYNASLTTGDLALANEDPRLKSWWFVNDDEYLIASGDFLGFKKVDVLSYDRVLHGGKDSILLLRRYYRDQIDHREFPIECSFEHTSRSNTYFLDKEGNTFLQNNQIGTNMNALTGSYSVQVNPNSRIEFFNTDYVQAGEEFVIRCWINNEGALASPVFEQIIDSLPTKKGLSQKLVLSKYNWNCYEIRFSNNSEHSIPFQLVLFNPSATIMYLDDLFVDRKLH